MKVFLTGPFSNTYWLGTTLTRAVPLIIVGLGIAIAFQARVFNIGAQGQLYIGALIGTLLGIWLQLPPALHILIIVLGSGIAGGLYALLPAYFKAKWGTNEIVTTLMFNFIALNLISYLLSNQLQDPAANYNVSAKIHSSARLPSILPPSPLHAGILIAAFLSLIVYLVTDRSVFGYRLRLSGSNPEFARYGGINRSLIIVGAMMLSGALAGLGGGIQIMGTQYRLTGGFLPKLGYDAINISLIGRNHPLGVIPAALFFAFLEVGGQVAGLYTSISPHLVNIIKASIFYLVTAQALFTFVRNLLPESRKKENLLC